MSYTQQDLRCNKCRRAASGMLTPHCECSGTFELPVKRDAIKEKIEALHGDVSELCVCVRVCVCVCVCARARNTLSSTAWTPRVSEILMCKKWHRCGGLLRIHMVGGGGEQLHHIAPCCGFVTPLTGILTST